MSSGSANQIRELVAKLRQALSALLEGGSMSAPQFSSIIEAFCALNSAANKVKLEQYTKTDKAMKHNKEIDEACDAEFRGVQQIVLALGECSLSYCRSHWGFILWLVDGVCCCVWQLMI